MLPIQRKRLRQLVTLSTRLANASNTVPVGFHHYVDVNAGESVQYAVTAIYADGTESAPVEVNVPTGIENVITDGQPVDVYTIDGKLVRRQTTTLRGLRKGTYVVGNKKIIIQ